MNRDDFISLLNDDLSTKYQSIVQYNLHRAVVIGAEFMSTIDELKGHLTQELNHPACACAPGVIPRRHSHDQGS